MTTISVVTVNIRASSQTETYTSVIQLLVNTTQLANGGSVVSMTPYRWINIKLHIMKDIAPMTMKLLVMMDQQTEPRIDQLMAITKKWANSMTSYSRTNMKRLIIVDNTIMTTKMFRLLLLLLNNCISIFYAYFFKSTRSNKRCYFRAYQFSEVFFAIILNSDSKLMHNVKLSYI